LLIKLVRTFNETLNGLLSNGKPAWAKVIAQKLKPPLDLAERRENVSVEKEHLLAELRARL
jgi:hypothetical protein